VKHTNWVAVVGVIVFVAVWATISVNEFANERRSGACRLRGYEAYDPGAHACYKRVYEPAESESALPVVWRQVPCGVADLGAARGRGHLQRAVCGLAGGAAGPPAHAPCRDRNDLDAYLANFWRALQRDPETVAYWADYPVNETDLHARHRWLVQSRKARASMARVKAEPDYFDAKIAGWWVWGQCLWIGSGWCQRPEWTGRGVGAAANRGVHNQAMSGRHSNGTSAEKIANWKARPDLHSAGGQGVHRATLSQQKPGSVRMEGEIHRANRRWQGGGQGGGSGVHAPRLSQKMPSIGVPEGRECGGGRGIFTQAISVGLYDYLTTLSARLRRVRVCCGDWHRVLTPSVTTYVGLCGVVLDPPYSHDMRERCYSEDHDISGAVREWALEHGDDPQFRIALCGYEGEHEMPDSWECVEWKAHGGYARTERGKENRERERVWFSPHCLKADLPLFAGLRETDDGIAEIQSLESGTAMTGAREDLRSS
jgi:hypothetical protein